MDESINPEQSIRRPKGWVAALLTLPAMGLGHFYAGAPWRALLIIGALALWNFATLALLVYSPAPQVVEVAFVVGWGLALVLAMIDAARQARRHYGPRQWYQRWWALVLIWFAMFTALREVGFTVKTFWVESYVLPSGGMADTLLPGDRFLAEKLLFNPARVRRGEVVTFHPPFEPEAIFVQRVVGLPGETFELRDEQVYINGEPLDEPYVTLVGPGPDTRYPQTINLQPQVVPPGHVFVLGDNRRVSNDSRLWGPLPIDSIIGRAAVIYMSLPIEQPDPGAVPQAPAPGDIPWERFGLRIE